MENRLCKEDIYKSKRRYRHNSIKSKSVSVRRLYVLSNNEIMFEVQSKHISHLVLVFLLLALSG